MSGSSWSHKLARPLIRPLLGTWVRPNHVTTLRVFFGFAACAAFAYGTPSGNLWGGVLWLVSAFLDRVDGELARMGNLGTEWGHLYDYYSDNAVSGAFFFAAGIGASHGWLGGWGLVAGAAAGIALLLAGWWSELLERRSGPGVKAYEGRWGFDPDDALYLLAPFAWMGWLPGILVAAGIVTPIVALVTGLRLKKLRDGQIAAAAAAAPVSAARPATANANPAKAEPVRAGSARR